jgi:hypothetical protein
MYQLQMARIWLSGINIILMIGNSYLTCCEQNVITKFMIYVVLYIVKKKNQN